MRKKMNMIDGSTPEEKNCIQELKKRLIHEVTPKMLEDPSLFYRFSKARNFNLKQAENMLRKNIAWRKEHNVDTLTKDYKMPEVFEKYSTSSFLCYDKEGYPVRYFSISESDMPGLIKSAKRSEFYKYNMYLIEKDMEILQQQSKKLGKLMTTIVHVCNVENLSLINATHKEGIQMSIEALKMFQDNYPERINSMYVINAAIYFTVMFSLLKPILAEEVINKIKVYGSDGWKETLLKIIDADKLPAFLGGNKTDPDGNPLCHSFIGHGGKVPEKYYLKKSNRTLHQEPGVKKIKVTRFSKADIVLDVKQPGSILEWEFETKSKDIAFGLYYKASDEKNAIELIPKQRIDTWVEPETGLYKCEKVGSYIIVFDNSYSWIHSKDIFYRAKIVLPNDQECV